MVKNMRDELYLTFLSISITLIILIIISFIFPIEQIPNNELALYILLIIIIISVSSAVIFLFRNR